MTTRTAKPDNIHNLSDWVKRWTKFDNLEFDSVSREPSVYAPLKRGDPARVKITNESLRWKREADVITVLSKPNSFSPETVEAANAIYKKYHTDMENLKLANIDVLRQREKALLDAWDTYSISPSAVAMRDIITAQKDFTAIEKLLTEQTHQGRATVYRGIYDEYKGIYDPALPWSKRGLGSASAV